MSAEYTPVGKHVADGDVRTWRYTHYDAETLGMGHALLNTVVDRIDDIMGESRIGCSGETDGTTLYHSYERTLHSRLGRRADTTLHTQLSVARIAYRTPVRHVTENYSLTLEHSDHNDQKLLGISYLFTRYVQSGLAAQVQYSLDLPDWAAHPENIHATQFWNDATLYDIQQLDDELFRLKGLQTREDNRAFEEQSRDFSL